LGKNHFLMEPVYFSEKQRFTQAWLWISFGLQSSVALTILFLIPNPATWWVVGITAAVALLLSTATLHTQVRPDGIHYRFFPFHRRWRHIPRQDIRWYYLRTYEPISEYGGWGLRRSAKHGRAYNTRGDQGLQLELTNGQKILFGTGHGEAFREALERL
jgi:hypothetical protein